MGHFAAPLLALTFVFAVAVSRIAAQQNVTIDDNDWQVSYHPPGLWSQGSTCGSCDVQLDKSQVDGGTWHDTTYFPDAQDGRSFVVTFVGAAVYVYIAVVDVNGSSPTTETHLQFTMDGVLSTSTYNHIPDGNPEPTYNVLAYSVQGLDDVSHTLVVAAVPDLPSLILLDYIVYTVPGPHLVSAPKSSSSHTTTVANGTPALPQPSSVVSTLSSIASTLASTPTTDATHPAKSPIPLTTQTINAVPSHLSSDTFSSPSAASTSIIPPLTILSTPSQTASVASTSSVSTPVVVGASLGGVGVLISLAIAMFLLRRHASHKRSLAQLKRSTRDIRAIVGSDSDYAQKRDPSPEPDSAVTSVVHGGSQDGPGVQPPSWFTADASYANASVPRAHAPLHSLFIPDTSMQPALDESGTSNPRSSSASSPSAEPRPLMEQRALGKRDAEHGDPTDEMSPVSPSSLPTPAAPVPPEYRTYPFPENAVLHAQLTALQEEVARLQEIVVEAPPRYGQEPS